MPCDQVRTTIVDIAKLDGALLQAALRSLGYEVSMQGEEILFKDLPTWRTHRYANGKLYLSGVVETDRLTNRIKQAYSTEVVKATAKRFGWTLKQDAKNQNKFNAIRRG